VGGRGGHGGYGGYGGRGYGYGGYGWGYGGFGWGLGLGLGLGLYGAYPYYGYPYGYGYPYAPYPYGYPGYAAAPPTSGPPVGPVVSGSAYGYPYAGAPPSAGTPIVPVVPGSNAVLASGGTTPPGKSPDTDVTLIVRTPADAIVWINGVKTTQTGSRREFVSSGLAQGRNYTFDMRAEWTGLDGKSVEIHRRVPAQAGERRLVDFTLPAPSQSDIATVEFGSGSK